MWSTILPLIPFYYLFVASASSLQLRQDAGDLQTETPPPLYDFDYVIVGGGVSGLTVANRLTENSNISVLVIEAGDLDQGEDFVTIPALAGGAIGTKYDWNFTYVPNPNLQNRSVPINQGRVVGGGSILNRMVFDRGSTSDYDRWEALGNPGWGWKDLYPYFKKSENSTAPLPNVATEYEIDYDASAHSNSGNVHSAYTPFVWPSTDNFKAAMVELGVNIPKDGANGEAIGAFWVPHSQEPTLNVRSSARTAEYDPVKSRPNLKLWTNTRVTKLITRSTPAGAKVTGIEYATNATEARKTVTIGREAILAAGSLHTPHLLQLSGIGPESVLTNAGVTKLIDIPGVGFNLQDHPYFPVPKSINTTIQAPRLTNDPEFAAEQRAIYDTNRTGAYADATGNLLAFLPLIQFSSNTSKIVNVTQQTNDFLAPNTPPSVKAGFTEQRKILNAKLLAKDSAVVELIYADDALVAGLQHPYSRGSVTLSSSDPFVEPTFDSGFFSHPVDALILSEAFKYSRKIFATKALQEIATTEIFPGSSVQTDEQIDGFLRSIAGSLWHPVGTCAMLPKASGGVVGTDLKVYGTTNIRVVDASIFPLLPATHIQSTVYAVAEKAADLIKASS